MGIILLIAGVSIALFLLLRWVATVDSKTILKVLRITFFIALVVALVLLLLTGRAMHGLVIAVILLPFIWRWYRVRKQDESSARAMDEGHRYVPGQMTLDQAYDILGLDRDATQKDVMSAYKRLIKIFHPDRGGSEFLASQLNEAKDKVIDHLNSAPENQA